MAATWRYHHNEFPTTKVFGHTYDKDIGVQNGFKFSLDIQTQYPTNLNKLDDKVKGAMYTMQRTDDQKVQVTPTLKRSVG